MTKNPIINLKRLGVPDDNILRQSGEFLKEYKVKINSAQADAAKDEIEKWDKNLSKYCSYIKLHGSQDFFDENNRPVFVTGEKKTEQIGNYKLITLYKEIFEQVLAQPCRFIIIGYGFNDEHINATIEKAVEKNCELYIVENIEMKNFFKKIKKEEFSDNIRKCLKGYLSKGLNSIDLRDEMIENFLPHQ